MTEFYDALEVRPPAEREASLMAALPALVAHAQARAPAWAAHLAGVEAGAVNTRQALAALPVLRKSALLERQRERRAMASANAGREGAGGRDGGGDGAGDGAGDAFGGFATIGWGSVKRGVRKVFQSPGPLYEPEGEAPDYWRLARALHAAGLRRGQLLHNSFSYHLTPAGSMMEGAALALGCSVFPGGVGNTELQLQALAELRADAYCGTPSFLRIVLERAAELQQPLPALRRAIVSGEACPPSLRDWLAGRGVDAYQCYATADVGLIAYETAAREGLVIDEGVIVEIVQPGGDQPLPDGEVGELVVTTLNPDYPMIRFGTGDLSAVLPGPCPTGRSNKRIRGWLGRADQTTKVRGMFVHAQQIAELQRRHPALQRVRLVVDGEMANDRALLRAEVEAGSEGLAERLADTLRELTKLRCEVELVAPASLPNDGRLIDDQRSYR